MSRFRTQFYCLLLFFATSIATDNLTISIIVPCHVKHADLLYDLLKIYTQQTVLPDEVVVSISQARSLNPSILERIYATHWPFKVNILTSDRVQYPGINRNIACSNAKGDIFILNDADDIPHPQRNEIITYAFRQYACDHVAHCCLWLSDDTSDNAIIERFFTKYDVNQLSYVNPPDFKTAWNMPIHNGNIAIRAKVFSQVQWRSKKNAMDDTLFNAHVYNQFANRIVVHAPLILYRNYLSALAKEDSVLNAYKQQQTHMYEQYKTMLQLNGFQVRDY